MLRLMCSKLKQLLENKFNNLLLRANHFIMRIVHEIIQNGDFERAFDNALILEKRYDSEGKTVFTNIKEMNPFTSVHRLVEQFMVRLSKQ